MIRTMLKLNWLILFLALFLDASTLFGQQTENLFLITLDGLRWEEVFSGADPNLVSHPEYVNDSARLKERFWHEG